MKTYSLFMFRVDFMKLDPWLLHAVLALLLLGLVMLASTTLHMNQQGDPWFFFRRQMLFCGLGVSIGILAWHISLAYWERFSVPLLFVGVSLLVLVLIPGIGHLVNGSMRWFHLGILNFQPSELMKLLMVIYLAGYLQRRSAEVRKVLRGSLKALGLLVCIAGLILLEPDYGATVVLFSTVLGMLFTAGVPMWQFWLWLAVSGVALFGVVLIAPYRVARLTIFMDPWTDPFDRGFQLTQALIAIGRGEWFGVGLGNSIQKLTYLPEAHTDFLFAVIAEELGLAGMLVVIGLFAVVVLRAFAIARAAERRNACYAAYLAYGIGLCIGLQALINLGVNMGLLPTKGLTLPFISYGGSSLVLSCLMISLLLRVADENQSAVASEKIPGKPHLS